MYLTEKSEILHHICNSVYIEATEILGHTKFVFQYQCSFTLQYHIVAFYLKHVNLTVKSATHVLSQECFFSKESSS